MTLLREKLNISYKISNTPSLATGKGVEDLSIDFEGNLNQWEHDRPNILVT